MQNVFIFFQWWAVRRVTIVCLFPSVYVLQVAFLESRYEFMNSITIHYILYTIITLTLIISLQTKKKKKIMSNAYMVKRSWLFSLGFFFFFLVVLERKGCPNNNLHESFGVWHFGRYRDLLWLLRLNLLIQFSAGGQKGQKKKVFRIL